MGDKVRSRAKAIILRYPVCQTVNDILFTKKMSLHPDAPFTKKMSLHPDAPPTSPVNKPHLEEFQRHTLQGKKGLGDWVREKKVIFFAYKANIKHYFDSC